MKARSFLPCVVSSLPKRPSRQGLWDESHLSRPLLAGLRTTEGRPSMSTLHRQAVRLVTGVFVVASLAGCAATEENPLNVNAVSAGQPDAAAESSSPRPTETADSSPSATPDNSPSATPDNDTASFISESLGDDPLNIRADGATLCGVQPQDSILQYTIMLHNPTLDTFTFDSIDLVDAQGLSKVDAKVARANREGHGNHGASPAQPTEHGTASHDAPPTPSPAVTEPSAPVAPVPAVGYLFEPDQHINIVVSVALDDAAIRGTADDVLVGFSSSSGRQFSVPHDLNITIDRTTCA